MKLDSRRNKLMAALLIAVLSGAAVLLFLRQDDNLPENAAFEVDGEVVTVTELNDRVEVLEALYGIEAPPESAEQPAAFREAAAQSIALSMILDVAAIDRDIVIADKAASDVLDKIIASEFPELGHAGYVRTLGNSGVTEADVIEEVKRQLAIQQLFDEVTADVTVSDSDVEAAFAERRAELGVAEARRISNIVVRSRGDATRVVNRLRTGTAFATLVRQASLDASTRDRNGDLGLVTLDQLEPDYGQAAFTARQGAMFGPVRSVHGWNVGVVREIRSEKPATFEDVAEQFKAQLQSEAVLEQWRDFLELELDEADVRYADKYRPADPDALPETGPLNKPSPGLPISGSDD